MIRFDKRFLHRKKHKKRPLKFCLKIHFILHLLEFNIENTNSYSILGDKIKIKMLALFKQFKKDTTKKD